jgi:hypothetical protein
MAMKCNVTEGTNIPKIAMNIATKIAVLGVAALTLASCGEKSKTADATPAPGTVPATAEAAKVEPAKVEAPPPVTPAPEPLVIPAGTKISVRTTTALSTKNAETGAPFSGSLSAPLIVKGETIAPKGAPVEGVVANSDDGGRVKGVASISLRLTKVEIHGKMVPVKTGVFVKEAKATKKKDALKVGIGAGIGAAIGAIAGGGKGAAIGAGAGGAAGTGVVLATHGDPAVVGAESLISFKLTNPVTVRP